MNEVTERGLRLLVVTSTFPGVKGDGTPSFVHDLAARLSERMDVTVLAPGSSKVTDDDSFGYDVRRFRFFPRRWQDLADGAIIENLRSRPSRWLQVPTFLVSEIIAIRRLVRRVRPDVLHIHWIVPQGVAALFAARRVPWVVTTLGGDLYALNSAPMRWVKARVVRRAHKITTMNSDMCDRVTQLGASPTASVVLPMGADTEAMEAARHMTPIGGRLMVGGRLVEKKGIHVLLSALRLVKSPGWSLDVVGDGPERERLEALAHGMPVRFLGQLPKSAFADVVGGASIVLMPSIRSRSGDQDGLPVALLEAMSVGRAVIVSDLPGLADVVRSGIEGRVVPPDDAEALATAIDDLLGDDRMREQCGDAARDRAIGYSIDSISERYEQLILEVANGNRPFDLRFA